MRDYGGRIFIKVAEYSFFDLCDMLEMASENNKLGAS